MSVPKQCKTNSKDKSTNFESLKLSSKCRKGQPQLEKKENLGCNLEKEKICEFHAKIFATCPKPEIPSLIQFFKLSIQIKAGDKPSDICSHVN